MNSLPPIIKPTAQEGTKRILLTISYDGTAYAGWQWQNNAISVQQKVQEALTKVTGIPTSITGASRTDAGVHALGQRAHFDTFSRIPAEKYPFALNTCLPPDIRVLEGSEVPSDFHARFDSCGKLYTYRIFHAPHASAIYRSITAHVPYQLDIDLMQRSINDLVGTHDFSAFQAAGGTAKTTIRTLTDVSLTQEGELITFKVKGNAFLYNMVRIIVGTLLEVGMARKPVTAFQEAFETKNRLSLGMTAPANGLELTKVFYQLPIE